MSEVQVSVASSSSTPAAVASAGDYIALMKPTVMSLAVFTAAVGMAIAPVRIHPVLAITALILIAMGAGAAGALNMWYDADIDGLMQRTAKRPIPRGLIPREEAAAFGLFLAAFSVLSLGLLINWVASSLLAGSIVFYLVVYTHWLKRRTAQNIVIGGAAGAAPPVLGWTAVTGSVDANALLLFLIIFVWTPPHFWALAIARREEYARAGIPMLPVTHGIEYTRLHVLLYTVLLVLVTLLPFLTRMSGLIYLGSALVLNSFFLYYALALKITTRRELPMRVFRFSVRYLMWLFAALLVDHYLPTTQALAL